MPDPGSTVIPVALAARAQASSGGAIGNDLFSELMDTLIVAPGSEVALVLLVVFSVVSWAIIGY